MNTPAPAPAPTHNEKTFHSSDHVLKTPVWVTVVRIFQIILSFVVMGLAATLMHDAYLDEEGLAIATAVLTWIIVLYIIISEKVRSAHKLYHIIAVLSLEGFMLILWLATWAAVAARRATFVFDTTVSECYDDGSLFNSMTCFRKRDVILFKSGAAMLAAVAGVGALVWLLFIATFVWTLVMFIRGRKAGRFPIDTTSASTTTPAATESYQMEPKPTETVQVQQQPQQQPQQQQTIHQNGYQTTAYAQPSEISTAPSPQNHYNPSQGYSSGQPQQSVSPLQSNGPYSPPAATYSPQEHQLPQHQYTQQQQYQPSTSPAPYNLPPPQTAPYPTSSPPPQELQHERPFSEVHSSPMPQPSAPAPVHSSPSPLPAHELHNQSYQLQPQEMPTESYRNAQ